MKFAIRFKIGNRYGKSSRYSLVQIAVFIVDRYSLRERELVEIVGLVPGGLPFTNEDMEVRRVK